MSWKRLAGSLCVVLGLGVGLVHGGIRLVDESDSHLEILVDIDGLEEVSDEGGSWRGLRIPGFVPVFGESLGVWVPAKACIVAIPPDANVQCEVSDVSYYDIDDYRTRDVLRRLGDVAGEIPRRPAEVTRTGHLNHQHIAGLRIAPLVYDEDAKSLRIYTHFRVRVDFGSRTWVGAVGAGQRAHPAVETSLKRLVLNYEQGRRMRDPPATIRRQGDYFSSSTVWIKIKVNSTGMYCIAGEDLAQIGIDLGTVDPATVRVYSGGGLPLKETLAETNPIWMDMVPVKVIGGEDQVFGAADCLVFYGLALDEWADFFDGAKSHESFYRSFFSNYNCYWLTWEGIFDELPERMKVVDLPECDGCSYLEPQSFLDRVHIERNQNADFNVPAEDGWYWQPLPPATMKTEKVPTPNIDISRDAAVKSRVYDVHVSPECGEAYYEVELSLNYNVVEDTLWRAALTSQRVIDIAGEGTAAEADSQIVAIRPLSSLNPPNRGLPVCRRLNLAWFELYYWRKFISDGSSLYFLGPDMTGTVKYRISGFDTPTLYAFDISDQFAVKELRGFELSVEAPYSVTFFDTTREGSLRRYAVLSPEAFLKPFEISRAQLADIRYSPGAAYCVVTHEDLLEAGATMADFHGGEVVTTQQIYDEFAWGVPDVTAIRDFLRWRYENGPLAWVLLLGDATWDYRGFKQSPAYPNYVPSYERRYLPPFGDPYSTDDWFAYLEPSRTDSTADFPTVAISRLPAASPEEAEMLVQRAMEYASNPELGPWQNRVILVADDDHVKDGCEGGSRHTFYVEQLSDEVYPPVFEHIKVYLTEYPFEALDRKPKAKNDFIAYLNDGAVMANFVGHGDEHRLAQEEVFNPDAIEFVRTGNRLAFFIAASCNVSRFDEPSSASMAERLLRLAGGGTIGSLASTHLCLPGPNHSLNYNFVKTLFPPGFKDSTICVADAVKAAKLIVVTLNTSRDYWKNDEMYALFGDPAMKLAIPRLDVQFTATPPDTLKLASAYEVAASVRSGDGSPVSFQGTAEIHVREADDTTGYLACGSNGFFDYELRGSEIYRSTTDVVDGALDFSYFMPASAREGRRSTIRCFVTDGTVSGSGLLDSILVSGESLSEDDTGPEVEMIYQGRQIKSQGDTLLIGERMKISLSDESGIAFKGISESVPSVSAVYDDIERVDLADSVFAVDGDYTRAVVSFTVASLPPGEHTLAIDAFDNLNNLTTREYEVYLASPIASAGNIVYVFPNPSGDVCYIIWEYDNALYVDIEATIYTVSGRKIWRGKTSGVGSYHEIMWDGTDFAGDPVANGTYLVVVEAQAPFDPGFITSDNTAVVILR